MHITIWHALINLFQPGVFLAWSIIGCWLLLGGFKADKADRPVFFMFTVLSYSTEILSSYSYLKVKNTLRAFTERPAAVFSFVFLAASIAVLILIIRAAKKNKNENKTSNKGSAVGGERLMEETQKVSNKTMPKLIAEIISIMESDMEWFDEEEKYEFNSIKETKAPELHKSYLQLSGKEREAMRRQYNEAVNALGDRLDFIGQNAQRRKIKEFEKRVLIAMSRN